MSALGEEVEMWRGDNNVGQVQQEIISYDCEPLTTEHDKSELTACEKHSRNFTDCVLGMMQW